jgi:hypothetical protein
MPRRLSLALIAAAATLTFTVPGGARVTQNTLRATVGPGFNIILADEAGNRVAHLDPGTYTITVRDQSDLHNFHLVGAGVDQATDIEFAGTQTWTVTFTDAVYRYRCDAHPTMMKGVFAVGTASVPPPPPPPVKKKKAAPKKLAGSVGPGARISVRTASGARASKLKPGLYLLTVSDRSKTDNFHLRGKGVNVATGVAFTGSKKWKLRFVKGSYTYASDRHSSLKGGFRVT